MNKNKNQKPEKIPIVRKVTIKDFESEKGIISLLEAIKANEQFLTPENPRRFIQALIYEYRVWARKMLPKFPFQTFIQKVKRLPRLDAMNIINKSAATVFGCREVPLLKTKKGRNTDNEQLSFVSGMESSDGSFIDTRVRNHEETQSELLENNSEDHQEVQNQKSSNSPSFTDERSDEVQFQAQNAVAEFSDDL